MKNLVTGGTGFLGGHLIEKLLDRGEAVRALVRSTSNRDHLKRLDAELIECDLEDAQHLKQAAQDMDRVYHCAALASDWAPWEAFRTANITCTHNILEAALTAGVDKFIHISTTDVYGHPDSPVNETASYGVRGLPYGDTKIEGEKLVWEYYHKHGLPMTIIRPASIYGPRSLTIVMEIVDLLKKGGMVHIGKPEKSAGLAYAENVVDLILLAADSEKSVGQAYNCLDGSDISWRGYVERLSEILNSPKPRMVIPYKIAYFSGWIMEKIYGLLGIQSRPLLTRMAVEMFGTSQGFSIEKARRELGYNPGVDFEEGMRRVEAWLHETGAIS